MSIEVSTQSLEEYSDSKTTSTTNSEEETKEVLIPYIKLVQYPKEYDIKRMFHERFIRTEQSKKYKNYIYRTYSEIWLQYHMEEQERRMPATKFQIVTTRFQLLFVSDDNKLMYLDKDGKFLECQEFQLLKWCNKWLNPDELYLEFIYGYNRQESIRFQVIIVKDQNYYKIRTTSIHLEYDQLLLTQLFKKCYPKKIVNWYLFF